MQHHRALLGWEESGIIKLVIHRLIDEYITLVSVPGSLLRSTKEGKLGYFQPAHSRVMRNSSRNVASRIDVVLECGSTRPWVKSA